MFWELSCAQNKVNVKSTYERYCSDDSGEREAKIDNE